MSRQDHRNTLGGGTVHVQDRPYPKGPVERNPDNDRVVLADAPTAANLLHAENLLVQRRYRIQRRRQRIAYLHTAGHDGEEIARLEAEIREEGEEP